MKKRRPEHLLHQLKRRSHDEQVWGWTKYGRLSNLAAWDADELRDRVVDALIDLKFQPRLLQAFLRNAEIPVAA